MTIKLYSNPEAVLYNYKKWVLFPISLSSRFGTRVAAVYSILANQVNWKKYDEFSYEQLGMMLHCNANSIRKSFDVLVSEGYIAESRGGYVLTDKIASPYKSISRG